jgi:hypothetical protein
MAPDCIVVILRGDHGLMVKQSHTQSHSVDYTFV